MSIHNIGFGGKIRKLIYLDKSLGWSNEINSRMIYVASLNEKSEKLYNLSGNCNCQMIHM